jgi:hypothetical protein
MQERKTIVDAFDEEIKEPCYVDEMSNVFQLGVFCTRRDPSARPHMKKVLQILLGRNHPLVYGVKNIGSEYDSTPSLKNSKRERQSESDSTLASDNRSLCFTHRNHHYSLLTLKNKECYF